MSSVSWFCICACRIGCLGKSIPIRCLLEREVCLTCSYGGIEREHVEKVARRFEDGWLRGDEYGD
jgi:hypothetical protein